MRRGGGEVHVDVAASSACVEAIAGSAAFLAYRTALGGVEVDAVDNSAVRVESVGGAIEVDGVRAGTGTAVQVTHLAYEVVAAHVLHNLIEAVVIIQCSGSVGGTAVLQVEVGDIAVIQAIGADSGLV